MSRTWLSAVRCAITSFEMVVSEHGVESLGDVKLAVLETHGSISIVPMASRVVRTRKGVRQLRKR